MCPFSSYRFMSNHMFMVLWVPLTSFSINFVTPIGLSKLWSKGFKHNDTLHTIKLKSLSINFNTTQKTFTGKYFFFIFWISIFINRQICREKRIYYSPTSGFWKLKGCYQRMVRDVKCCRIVNESSLLLQHVDRGWKAYLV